MTTDIFIFLDLDGVFNGNYAFNESRDLFIFDHISLAEMGLKYGRGDIMSIYKLNVFRNLTKKYNVKIIGVSSCFVKLSTVEEYAKAFDLNIVDIGYTGGGIQRGEEVLKYINKHNIKNFIVVDDAGDRMYCPTKFKAYENWCIFPCGRFGLTDYNFECLEVTIKNFINNTNEKPYTYTTKTCYNCGSNKMVAFRSLNYKECGECYTRVEWNLDKDQKPLL